MERWSMNQLVEVDELILGSAVRYALGRRTYIVSVVCNEVAANLKIISDNMLNVVIRDIEECDNLGDDCDIKSWNILLEKLHAEKERRENASI